MSPICVFIQHILIYIYAMDWKAEFIFGMPMCDFSGDGCGERGVPIASYDSESGCICLLASALEVFEGGYDNMLVTAFFIINSGHCSLIMLVRASLWRPPLKKCPHIMILLCGQGFWREGIIK